jgi:hypothetical protein
LYRKCYKFTIPREKIKQDRFKKRNNLVVAYYSCLECLLDAGCRLQLASCLSESREVMHRGRTAQWQWSSKPAAEAVRRHAGAVDASGRATVGRRFSWERGAGAPGPAACHHAARRSRAVLCGTAAALRLCPCAVVVSSKVESNLASPMRCAIEFEAGTLGLCCSAKSQGGPRPTHWLRPCIEAEKSC